MRPKYLQDLSVELYLTKSHLRYGDPASISTPLNRKGPGFGQDCLHLGIRYPIILKVRIVETKRELYQRSIERDNDIRSACFCRQRVI